MSGYRKMLLAKSKFFKFDCFLIKVPDGCSIPERIDSVVDGFEHHHINITILASPASSKMHVRGPAKVFFNGKIILFRSDLYPHEIKPSKFFIGESALYLLSFGWLRRKSSHSAG